MSIVINPVGGSLAAMVSGISLNQPMTEEKRATIVDALDEYGVIVFRDQALSQSEQIAFAQQFGPLDNSMYKVMKHTQVRLGYDVLSDISNVAISGKVAEREHPQTIMNIGNQFWHSDGSFMNRPFRYSILAANTAVDKGGETEFADLRAAYDTLDDDMKSVLEGKVGEFYNLHIWERLGIVSSEKERAVFPPVHWPLIRTHPGSGRKVLWVDTKVRAISGMSVPEARALVDELVEHIGQRERVYSHKWRANDVVIWDNRAVLHRGRRFDLAERREMRRAGVLDDSFSLDDATSNSQTT